ncbi:lys-63-specific deubiquitinase BRCC36-like isoform X1 [Ceratina calcarata]|uniref:Lys-63-specific deubiquitinase BRCC36-like isoform X1 n=2 Tax=Ceratina calcarata TaxID=156304 RepID=A0AAJ7S316_9HYME|nr:lys-63-specific deubiquitinase BRCC36-like isoform X1 [Ceratina calcarata]XP_017882502.1 lys-63-specific deubiquitinase BRCC36-like isoform X1 [Ceratina calcarata]XP_017882503.1 lys-63-specific deubiquitinase BRCC36-like isoform X1 [Ceratina calcarata]XP_026670530.1 lys-63-specific deubiquitinase BRCC36-like isoform X1 [Ceratina calcarata]
MDTLALKKVQLQTDVYMVCLQHALSTEKFEVMGLLLGNTESSVAEIMAVIILNRLDKQKDRVEISSEQLAKACDVAEQLKKELQRPVRVLGWYHSHPHITVCPSHVDCRTQTSYQMMDPSFVGLIFSVFSENKESKEQEISLICFQSHNDKEVEIPLEIVHTPMISNTCLKTMTDLIKIFVQEEEEMAETCKDQQDILVNIHNDAVRTRALVHITDIITKPLILTFEKRLALNKLRAAYLRKQLQELQGVCNG